MGVEFSRVLPFTRACLGRSYFLHEHALPSPTSGHPANLSLPAQPGAKLRNDHPQEGEERKKVIHLWVALSPRFEAFPRDRKIGSWGARLLYVQEGRLLRGIMRFWASFQRQVDFLR